MHSLRVVLRVVPDARAAGRRPGGGAARRSRAGRARGTGIVHRMRDLCVRVPLQTPSSGRHPHDPQGAVVHRTVIQGTVVHTDHNGDAGAVEARVVAARRGSGAVGVLRCPSESYASTANNRSSLLIAASVTEVA